MNTFVSIVFGIGTNQLSLNYMLYSPIFFRVHSLGQHHDCPIASAITDLMVHSTTLKSQQTQTKFQKFAYFLGRSVNTFWGVGEGGGWGWVVGRVGDGGGRGVLEDGGWGMSLIDMHSMDALVPMR